LDFVQKNISPLSVVRNAVLNVFLEADRIQQVVVIDLFKINGDDVAWRHSAVQKMLSEKGEEKITLPTTADSGYDFYKFVVFCRNQAVQVDVAVNRCVHGNAVIKLWMNMPKLETAVVYHRVRRSCNSWPGALKFRSNMPKLEVGRAGRLWSVGTFKEAA